MDTLNIGDRLIDVLERRTVYNGFISVDDVQLRYQKPDGSMSDVVERVSVERGDAVAVLAWIAESEKLALVRQFRYPILRHGEPWLTEIVAGSIDKGESPEAAARRELREETGLESTDLHFIADYFGSPGASSEKITIYFASIGGSATATNGGLPGEDLEILYISPKEISQQLRAGRVHDGKTQVALYWFFSSPFGMRFTEV